MAKPARPSAAKKKAPRSRKAATTAAEDPTTARATKTASGTKAVALDERSAWSDDEPLPHDTVRVRLRRGTPVVLPAGAVDVLLDAGYPPAYEAEKFVGPAVSQLLASPR